MHLLFGSKVIDWRLADISAVCSLFLFSYSDTGWGIFQSCCVVQCMAIQLFGLM